MQALAVILAFGCAEAFHVMPRSSYRMKMSASFGISRRDAGRISFTLLGGAGLLGIQVSRTSAAPEYLAQPTEEFDAIQKRAAEFERGQLEKKRAWRDLYANLEKASNEPELVGALDNMTQYALKERGLPTGLKKQSLITDIRKVKKAGRDKSIWNKDAEVSYEQLIYTINYNQSPNTNRALTVPL